MNAPIAAAALKADAFRIVPLSSLAVSGTLTQDRRRSRFKKEDLEELARSIRTVGIMQPIVVRCLIPGPSGEKLQIVAGERRYLASKIAGLAEIPVVVRDISDADLVEFQLVENLQRKTIDQLEEALGYSELRKAKNLTPEQVADRVGVSRSTVFNRLKLLDLCPEAIKALEDGTLPASNAILIARIAHHDTQRAVLKPALKSRWDEHVEGHDGEGPLTYRELSEFIAERYMISLKGAPFKLDDAALLPKAGTCVACPKRAGNQKDLFADVKNPNVCTDPKCFDDKRQAVFRVKADELRAQGRKVIAGADAKKIMPRWDDDMNSDRIAGGFHAMGERLYDSSIAYGKTPAQLLGKEYQPVIVQHPGSGELIEVATAQAIAALAKGKKPGRDDDVPGIRRAKKAPKSALPDLDDQVTQRMIKLIAEKAPKSFSRGVMLQLARMILPEINTRDDKLEMVAAHYGWPKRAFRPSWQRVFPKQAVNFDEAKLTLLLLYMVFAAGWTPQGNASVSDFLGINTTKLREQIIGERKAAQVAARAKAKLQKASPVVKTKAKGKKK